MPKRAIHTGFTLIETLIALVIVSIALSAMLFAVNQYTRAQSRIENNLSANWLANNTWLYFQARPIVITDEPNVITAAHQRWAITTQSHQAESAIDAIVISVKNHDHPPYQKTITGYRAHDR